MRAVTVSSLRSRMRAYFDEVSESSEIIVVPRNNNDDDAIVIMSIRDYNSLVETDHLFSSKANADRLAKSKNELQDGDTVPFNLDDE